MNVVGADAPGAAVPVSPEPPVEPTLWRVIVTVAGDRVEETEVRAGAERLVEERGLMLAVRYRADRAELSYWEQADRIVDANALALRLWSEHRESASLPPWGVVGVEVLDRETFELRIAEGSAPLLYEAGAVQPWRA